MQSPARNPGGAGAGSRLTTGVPLVILTGLLAGLLAACWGFAAAGCGGWSRRGVAHVCWFFALRYGTVAGLVAAWRPRAAPLVGLAVVAVWWLYGSIESRCAPPLCTAPGIMVHAGLGVALAVAPLLAGWVVRRYLDPCPPAASPAPPPAPRLQRGGA